MTTSACRRGRRSFFGSDEGEGTDKGIGLGDETDKPLFSEVRAWPALLPATFPMESEFKSIDHGSPLEKGLRARVHA